MPLAPVPPIGTCERMNDCRIIGDLITITTIQFDKDARQINIDCDEAPVGRRMVSEMDRQRYGLRLGCAAVQVNREWLGLFGGFFDVNQIDVHMIAYLRRELIGLWAKKHHFKIPY